MAPTIYKQFYFKCTIVSEKITPKSYIPFINNKEIDKKSYFIYSLYKLLTIFLAKHYFGLQRVFYVKRKKKTRETY